MVGFMGCYAAMNALKLARHIIRSEPGARVLVVNLELCTLHLKPGKTLEEILPFLIFSDGCAASVLSSHPRGIEMQGFTTNLLPDTEHLITWKIGELGFDMNLSGQVPASIATHLPAHVNKILAGCTPGDITHWAIHPGGRTVLDAVRDGVKLEEHSLAHSRDILRRFGNMSSATIMFVLKNILDEALPGQGCAIAFGPGLSVESMRFAV
jgi:predicted naringenin-chalcone synthase